MNKENMQQIFSHYLDKFEYITDKNRNDENYKWFIAKKFRALMDEALTKDGNEFAPALYKVKIATENIIDSYTQPFSGLVEFAKCEPETVKQMFINLYSDDGGDIHLQEKLISDFFDKSNELLEKYSLGSHLYKQNSHSVSAYLFLYDPDNHYMYKASQSKIFADCIEFYEDWGSGDNIKLDLYYKMCDWLVEQILLCPELLKTNESRFNLPNSNEMFADTNKHMLAFDIIYACSVYDLFDGISFTRPKMREKNLIIERKNTALRLLENYNKALEEMEYLNQAIKTIENELGVGITIQHKMFGKGEVLSYNNGIIEVSFDEKYGIKKLAIAVIFSMGLAKFEDEAVAKNILPLIPKLKNKESIPNTVRRAEQELQPYKEYLE